MEIVIKKISNDVLLNYKCLMCFFLFFDDASMLQSCPIYSSQFFFQAINSRYRFLHCMGGQTPTWIRDGQMARKKCFMEGRMEKKN